MSIGSYNLVALAKIDSGGLNIIPFASVEVRDSTNTSLATIYSDAAGNNPITQPTQVDSNGQLHFYAEEGRYVITVDNSNVKVVDIAVAGGGGGGGGGGSTYHAPVGLSQIGTLNLSSYDYVTFHYHTVIGRGGDTLRRVIEGVVDGRLIYQDSAGNLWERNDVKVITPEMFGALGDDVDDTQALHDARLAAIDSGVGAITLTTPGRIYRYTETLPIGDGFFHIVGQNVGSGQESRMPCLRYDGAPGTWAISTSNLPHGSIQGFYLSAGNLSVSGFDAHLFRQCKIHDLHVDGFVTGIRTSHFWVADFNSIRLTNNGIGWHHRTNTDVGRTHSDFNGVFARNIQAIYNDVGLLFDAGTNFRKVDIDGNIELNRIGLQLKDYKSIQNLKVSTYWERNSESDISIILGPGADPFRHRIDFSDSYFFSQLSECVFDIDTTNATQVLEIVLDRCNFTHKPSVSFVRTLGNTSFIRFFSGDCRDIYSGGPTDELYHGWKRSSMGPGVSTIRIPLLSPVNPHDPNDPLSVPDWEGTIYRVVGRDGTVHLRGEVTININVTTGRAVGLFEAYVGVFDGDFNSYAEGDKYYPVLINGATTPATSLRIQSIGDGALVNEGGLGLVAGDVVTFEISSYRPPA